MDEIEYGPPISNSIITQQIFTPTKPAVLKLSPISPNQVSVCSIPKAPVQKVILLQVGQRRISLKVHFMTPKSVVTKLSSFELKQVNHLLNSVSSSSKGYFTTSHPKSTSLKVDFKMLKYPVMKLTPLKLNRIISCSTPLPPVQKVSLMKIASAQSD